MRSAAGRKATFLVIFRKLRSSLQPLPARKCRRDADFVAICDDGSHSIQKADILAVHMDQNEAADFASFVVDTLLEARKRFIEVLDNFTDGGPRRADLGEFIGEFTKWCWNKY